VVPTVTGVALPERTAGVDRAYVPIPTAGLASGAGHAILQPMNRLDRPGLAILILAVIIGLIGLITGNWLVALVALLLSISMVLRLRSLRGKNES
jgi:hypothetical protein